MDTEATYGSLDDLDDPAPVKTEAKPVEKGPALSKANDSEKSTSEIGVAAQAPKKRETLFASPEEEDKVIRQLTESFLDNFHAPLEQISDKMAELQTSQEALLSAINVEREKLESIPFFQNISQTLSKVGPYQQKAAQMKRNMVNIRERVNKLQKRAQKLRERKDKELLAAAEKQEKEQERERQLTAQPSKSLLEKSGQPQPEKENKDRKTLTSSSSAAATSSTPSTASSSSASSSSAASSSTSPAQPPPSSSSSLKTSAFSKGH